MIGPRGHRACTLCSKAPLPADIGSVGLCLAHYTLTVERTCQAMHRQIVMHEVTAERLTELARYIGESALLLSRVTSNLCLSDELKRRVLSTFLSLMNLRENLERAGKISLFKSEVSPAGGAEVQATGYAGKIMMHPVPSD